MESILWISSRHNQFIHILSLSLTLAYFFSPSNSCWTDFIVCDDNKNRNGSQFPINSMRCLYMPFPLSTWKSGDEKKKNYVHILIKLFVFFSVVVVAFRSSSIHMFFTCVVLIVEPMDLFILSCKMLLAKWMRMCVCMFMRTLETALRFSINFYLNFVEYLTLICKSLWD